MNTWVIVINNDKYLVSDAVRGISRFKLSENITEATLMNGDTKQDVEGRVKDTLDNCMCGWEVVAYEEAVKAYKEKHYFNLEGKEYKWGKYVDIKEALEYAQSGGTVCYEYNGEEHFIFGNVPQSIRTDIIFKAKFRLVEDLDTMEVK